MQYSHYDLKVKHIYIDCETYPKPNIVLNNGLECKQCDIREELRKMYAIDEYKE